jgi:hypothetical protein
VTLTDDPATAAPLLRLRRSAAGAVTFAVDARLDARNSGLPLAGATGTLDAAGLGSLTVRFGDGADVPLRWGPIQLGGSFRFTRALAGPTVVSEFQATDARLAFGDLVEQTLPLLRISTDGSLRAELPAATIGVSDRVRVSHGGLVVAVDARGLDARLTVLDPFVSIPALAEPAGRLGVRDGRIQADSFTIRTADFAVPLVDLRSFDLGPVSIDGALVLERTGGQFQVRVTSTDAPVTPVVVRIDGFADIEVDPFTILPDGSFTPVDVDVDRIGPPELAIRNARIEVRKPTRALTSFAVRIIGGQLVLPTGSPIDLPTLTIDATRGFDQRFSTPTLDLGPLLQFTSRAIPGPDDPQFPDDRIVWRLSLVDGVVRFELADAPPPFNEPGVSLLAGSASSRLLALSIGSDGTFAGEISSRLSLFGRRLATARYSISRADSGIVTLRTIAPATYDFGFVQASMSGSVSSSGAFSFTGTAEVDQGVCPGGCIDGRVTMRIRDTGISGSYSGQACALGVCGSAAGTVTNSGVVSGTIVAGSLVQPFEFRIGGGPGGDSLAPTFVDPLLDLTVRADVPTSNDPRYRVNYTSPRAVDERPGGVSVVCTPASGTMFRVGRTEVTCVASDAAGNRRTGSFDVVLIDETLPVLAGFVPGEQITVTVTEMDPRFPVRATFFSEPVDAGQFTPASDGTLTVTVTVPRELTPGEHQLVLTGRGPDGSLNAVAFTFTVFAPVSPDPGPLPDRPGQPGQPARPDPTGGQPVDELPATGSGGIGALVALATALGALGIVLRLVGGPRRNRAASR